MVIVNQAYCAPAHVDITVRRNKTNLMDGDFVMIDGNGNLLFTPLHGLSWGKMVLLDGSGTPILTMKKKTSLHGRWKVYRGVSTEESDLLYTVKRSYMANIATRVDVFLRHNKKEKTPDFRVKGTWLQRSCTVYAGESDTVVAELQKKDKVEKKVDNFSVMVYPNVDSAFMASLTIILDHLIRQDRNNTIDFASELVLPGSSLVLSAAR